jgi:hypothetical protein
MYSFLHHTMATSVFNFTGRTIEIWTHSTEFIASLPNDGNLRLRSHTGPPYIHHHIHHYSAIDNEEGGIPVCYTEPAFSIDTMSPGYSKFKALAPGDKIIVTPDVANFLRSDIQCQLDLFTVGEDPTYTIYDEAGQIVGYTSLKWYP